MHLIRQLLSHIENIDVCIILISLGTKEECIGQSDGNDVLYDAHVEGRSLEAVAEYDQVHSSVVCDGYRWIYFLLEACVVIDFECVRHPVHTLIPDECFLEDERCISLHILDAPILLAVLVDDDVEFLHWL